MLLNGQSELLNFFDSVMRSPLGEPDYDEREYGFSDDERDALWERESESLESYPSLQGMGVEV